MKVAYYNRSQDTITIEGNTVEDLVKLLKDGDALGELSDLPKEPTIHALALYMYTELGLGVFEVIEKTDNVKEPVRVLLQKYNARMETGKADSLSYNISEAVNILRSSGVNTDEIGGISFPSNCVPQLSIEPYEDEEDDDEPYIEDDLEDTTF